MVYKSLLLQEAHIDKIPEGCVDSTFINHKIRLGVSSPVESGMIPLHFVLRRSWYSEAHCHLNHKLVVLLLDKCPESASHRNRSGLHALHIACKFARKMPVLQLLMNVFPEGLLMEDEDGMLPLFFAAENHNRDLTDLYVLTRRVPGLFENHRRSRDECVESHRNSNINRLAAVPSSASRIAGPSRRDPPGRSLGKSLQLQRSVMAEEQCEQNQ
jgi:hypothetical protein